MNLQISPFRCDRGAQIPLQRGKRSNLHFWRAAKGNEVDLVIEAGPDIVPVNNELDSRNIMDSTRFLLDFEVEAHACINEELGKIFTTHPLDDYEVHLSNIAVEHGTDRPLLSVHLIVSSNNPEEARQIGTEKLREYLHLLTFITNFSFKTHRLIRIIDWTPGLKERLCLQYERSPKYDISDPVLGEEYFKSIEMLQKTNISNVLKRALKWFSNGVSGPYLDDQFQYFWFVLEILAEIHKKPGKVNDLCPKCRTPLYCKSCNALPTHRPYPKQAIYQLISTIVIDDPDGFFKITNDVRNCLMHGDDIEHIEKTHNVNLSQLVDSMGQVAWIAIFETFRKSLEEAPNDGTINFIRTNMYTHNVTTLAVNLTVFSSNPFKPDINEIPKIQVKSRFSCNYDDRSNDGVVLDAANDAEPHIS